jgi:threonylcarbamoyladenosine tRNA methylthiotransferase MtaB
MSFPGNPNPTFIIKTLGCKVNQYESQAMRESLVRGGFSEKADGEIADFYVINSCTVTRKADRETRGLIRHFHKINPPGKIAITGCYAELDTDRNALTGIAGVTHLIRNTEKGRIAEILMTNSRSGVSAAKSSFGEGGQITGFKDRDRAFVKIQDGCDNKCSYCKVPLVRGASRSRSAEDILAEVKLILEKSFKEIVLTGICLGAWGRGMTEKMNLSGLVKAISMLDGSFRIRLSSIEPVHVTDDIINTLKENDKVCKHLHIPLQSGDNRILRAMRRPYTREKFAGVIAKLRKHIPDMAITTDILAGFPGEEDAHFRNTLEFIKRIRPSRMHVFSYSKREGTPASKYDKRPDKETVKERVKILVDLGKDFSMDFAKGFIDKTQSMLVESHRDEARGFLTGYTDRYIRVFADGEDSLKNSLISVKIFSVNKEKNMILGHLDFANII